MVRLSLASTCDLSGPADAVFAVPVKGERVKLVIEIWGEGADPAWISSVLDVLEARSLGATLVLPAGPPDPALLPLLARARDQGVEIAVLLPDDLLPNKKGDDIEALEEQLGALERQAGPIRTAVAEVGSRQREAMLGRAGLRTLIDETPSPGSEPRMAGSFEGQPRTRVVLSSGLYDDACGPSPVVGPFGPKAADRAAVALQRATRVSGSPVVRLGLDGSRGSPDDAAVLGRWLDGIVLPGGVQVVTANEARKRTLATFRSAAPAQAIPDAGGRLVSIDALREAAAALRDPSVLPRSLPGDLNPTEAFFGFVLLLADHTEGAVVRLGAMSGPASDSKTSLTGPVSIDRGSVRDLAVALERALPSEVPAALPVDGRLLTAAELLIALAAAVRGDDPVVTGPVAVPEPNERGLGWGSSTLP